MTGAALRRNAFAIRRDESDSLNAFFAWRPNSILSAKIVIRPARFSQTSHLTGKFIIVLVQCLPVLVGYQ